MDPISSYNLEFWIIAENMRGGKWYGMSEVVDADRANYRNVVEGILDVWVSGIRRRNSLEAFSIFYHSLHMR